MRRVLGVCATVALLGWMCAAGFGQDAGGGNNGGGNNGGGNNGGGRGGRGNWDPAQFQQRMLERVKEQLGSTDDEWKVLGPKVEAVQKLVFAGGMRGMFGRRGGPGGDQPQPEPRNNLEKLQQELQALVEKKDADSKAVKEKLAAYRVERDKSKADLKKAQDELRELVSPKQEAQLVLMRLLD